jgi:drug/metabolite transporter (DMT)-like permease
VNPSKPHARSRGYVIALAATIAWSSSGIFIAYLTEGFGVPPLAVAVWRNLIITAVLFAGLRALAAKHLRLSRSDLPALLLFAVALAVLNATYPPSVAYNGAAVATVLIYSAPLFSAVAGRILLRESLGPLNVGAVVVGIGGCVLVSGAHDPAQWTGNPVGIALGLGTGLSFAAYGLLGRWVARRGIPTWTAMAYGFLVSTCLMLALLRGGAFGWLERSPLTGADGWRRAVLGWGALLGLALGPTLGGHGLYNASLVYLPASTATLIVTLEPPLTALLAYLLLGERMGLAQLLGSGLVLAGVVAVSMEQNVSRGALQRRARTVGGRSMTVSSHRPSAGDAQDER